MDFYSLCKKYGIERAVVRVSKAGTVNTEMMSIGTFEGKEIGISHIFDIASLTKLFTTTLALMMLDRGELALQDSVRKYFPQMDRKEITIWNLLTHTALMAVPLSEVRTYAKGRADYEQAIFSAGKIADMQYCYQCSNFILLGWILEKIGGAPLDILMQRELFLPLGMHDTSFGITDTSKFLRTLPTEIDEVRGEIRGEVHDPNAYLLGGVAGNAGIFTSMEDFSVFMDLWMGRGTYNGKTFLTEATVDNAWKKQYHTMGAYAQGLGWKLESPHESDPWTQKGSKLHGGFTGTFTLLLPEKNMYATVFTNFLYPEGIEQKGRGLFRSFVGEVFEMLFAG